MGNTHPEQSEQQERQERGDTQMTNRSVNTQAYLDPQEIEVESCCGIVSRRPTKEAWKNNFEAYCRQLQPMFKWVQYLLVAYNKYAGLPRAEYLKEVNALRYEGLEESASADQRLFQSRVINLEEAIEKSVLFPNELARKSMGGEKPVQMETRTTASFAKINKRKSILLAEGQQSRQRAQKFKVSFYDESMKELFKAKPTTKLSNEAAQQLAIFVRFSECVERHLSNEEHLLTILKRTFVSYLTEEYSENDPANEKPLTKDLQQFIRLFQELLWDYYRIEMLMELFPLCKLINQESLTNLVTSVMFKDPQVNRVVLRCYQQVCRPQEEKLMRLIDSNQGLTPSDMKVNEEYCLNKKTIDWYMEQLSAESMVENMAVSAVMQFTPYESCIVKLKQLEQVQTPIGKLKVIVSCAERIESCISQFYQLNSLPAKPSIVDADQILSIFTYIMVGSRIKRIYTHLKVIENFASKEQLKSMTGYYYNVILSAVTHLQNMERGYERDQEDAI